MSENTVERLRAIRGDGPKAGLPLALLVEDDPDSAEIARTMLHLCGFEVWHAASAGDALHITSTETLDLILLDVALPDMDGSEFLTVARKLPRFEAVQVVVASAVHPESSPMGHKLRKLGVQHFLDKPYTVARMRHKLRVLFPEAAVAGPHKLTAKEVEALALPGSVELNGERRPVRLVAASGGDVLISGPSLPRSAIVELKLRHRQDYYGALETIELAALAQVKESTVIAGKAMTRLRVQFGRPPLQWDRMTEELPDL